MRAFLNLALKFFSKLGSFLGGKVIHVHIHEDECVKENDKIVSAKSRENRGDKYDN